MSGGGSTSVGPQDCTGDEIAMPKRLIRLSFNQIASSLRPVFGEAFAADVLKVNQIPPTTQRTFPPLGDTNEGTTYIDAKWQSSEAIAAKAADHVFANFGTFTGCAEPATADCGKAFLLEHAEGAYRRPLNDREKQSLLLVYDEVTAASAGGTVKHGVQAGIRAIYDSPGFLYRTEFGVDASAGPLSPYELASQLSYFLTDGPPDAALLAAAAQNKLSNDAEIGAEVDRLLALPTTKANLQDTVFASFGVARVLAVVIDGLPQEAFNGGVAASMFRETQLFINNVLWNGGTVSELATSRRSFINARLAPLYGIPAPTVGLDADGFGVVDLPENRAGILTNLGFLTSRSRPDQQSVVGRGLAVNDAILCQENPAFPESLAAQIDGVVMMQASLSEREKAAYRGTTPPCVGCHPSFDPYGLSLENFDVIGRFRTMDPEGRPIDASVTLPPLAGGKLAANAVEVGKALADTFAISTCVGSKLLTYALAETGVSGSSCAAKAIADSFAKSDRSFGALVRAVALSKTLTQRSSGG
jgi:Protein of unknown function (DUF1592)/Protein of unknown function (DUF1588)/Protein of unknown function (DUF1595)/Protein of unknown function (DUF1585)